MKNADLRSMFSYCPLTGIIVWKITKAGVRSGTEFGSIKPAGKTSYIIGKVNKTRILAHRLAWFLHYGEWPNGCIDHINHNGTDNRIENLRVVEKSQNNKNATLRSDNSSGFCGVTFDKSQNKWIAQISVNGKRKHLGSFSSATEAAECRMAASRESGFHKNHGKVYCD